MKPKINFQKHLEVSKKEYFFAAAFNKSKNVLKVIQQINNIQKKHWKMFDFAVQKLLSLFSVSPKFLLNY
jgi:hypothetical protein